MYILDLIILLILFNGSNLDLIATSKSQNPKCQIENWVKDMHNRKTHKIYDKLNIYLRLEIN